MTRLPAPVPTPYDDQLGTKALDAAEQCLEDLDQLFWAVVHEMENPGPDQGPGCWPRLDIWVRYWESDIKSLVAKALDGTTAEVVDGDLSAFIPFRIRHRATESEGEALLLVEPASPRELIDIFNVRCQLIDIVNMADPTFVAPPPVPFDPYDDDF